MIKKQKRKAELHFRINNFYFLTDKEKGLDFPITLS